MRLKGLEILGFKSFADKTRLLFDPGITAVVGPNGCGKSNISDAFRWVLGEQSAKSMRGSKMPDVIFAGTTHRKPLNFAEVTITLTDIDGKLPVAYEEVAVTRRLHRSGESEYFINRHPVRLKDVQALFLDSGMGKDAYSIFEQGKIDQVINLSPLERRYIFEEAAGILRFLQRKKEALRKLEQTDQNVSRVKDIHQEVEKQIIVLEEQAEKARKYKENKIVLDKLEKSLLVSKWEALQSKLAEMQAKARGQEESISSTNAQIEALQMQLVEAKQALAEAEKTLRVRGEEVYSARSAKEIKTREKQNNQERLKELSLKEKRWEEELTAMGAKRKRREEDRKGLQTALKDTEKRHKSLADLVAVQREKVRGLEDELMKVRAQQQAKQSELFKLLQSESQSESQIRQTAVRLENAQEKQAHVQERHGNVSKAIQDLIQQAKDKKAQLEEAVSAVDEKKKIFGGMELNLQDIGQQANKTQEEIDTLQNDMSEAKARLKALQRLREDMEGFSSGSKKLLQEAANKNSPLFGKIKGLYEYIVPEKNAEAALAAVMKPYAQTLVVEAESDFASVVAYAKQHKIKDVSILCMEAISKLKATDKSPPTTPQLTPLAMHVIESELALHFLRGVYTSKQPADPIEIIKGHGGLDVWVGDGIYVDRHAVIFFASQGENNAFLREAEIKALEKKLQVSEQDKQQLDLVVRAIQQKRNQLLNERSELDKVIRQAEMKLVELNFASQKASVDLEKARNEEKQLANEWQINTSAIETLMRLMTELNQVNIKAKKEAAEAHQHTEQFNTQLEKSTATARAQAAELREKESALQGIADEQRKQAHALHVLEIQDIESSQQEKRLEEEIEIGRATQRDIDQKRSEADAMLHEVDHTLKGVMAACSELEQQVALRKSALEHLETKINEKRQHLKKHETERNQVGIQTAQVESNSQSLQNELQERHQLSVQQARADCGALEIPLDHAEKQLKALRQQIESAGDINMTSIEECEKHKTRYHFLNQQIDDMDMSRQELVAIIAELDGESRKIFQETFQQIRSNFKKNFEILFTGGEADLQFTESADVLEAGIEITAKPPGKQMRSINLLSGGEKCLTAMALLFAIFEVKPAPFCILDEIDAPLDDSNVERFVNIVKLFVDRCQFIIITHNKRTMAIADVICGVSMEERGVSKLLTMDFSKDKEPAMAEA